MSQRFPYRGNNIVFPRYRNPSSPRRVSFPSAVRSVFRHRIEQRRGARERERERERSSGSLHPNLDRRRSDVSATDRKVGTGRVYFRAPDILYLCSLSLSLSPASRERERERERGENVKFTFGR